MNDKVSVHKVSIAGGTKDYVSQSHIPWTQLKESFKARGGVFEDKGESFTYLSTIGTFVEYTRIPPETRT